MEAQARQDSLYIPSGVEWYTAAAPVSYPDAVQTMEERVYGIRDNTAGECVWLVEHPPLYTAGTSAKDQDLLDSRFPVFQTGRGGQYTYHGPGQRVAYVMLDLQKRGADLRRYIYDLEEWIIKTLSAFDVRGERREGRVGIWVDMTRYGRVGEAKIAAIGVRVKKWVTYHGLAINVAPDLDHFKGIVPCGIAQHGVTSLKDLGVDVDMQAVDEHLRLNFRTIFE